MSPDLTVLSCEEVDELAAAWALDAVPPNEVAAIDAHLLRCTRGHPLLVELAEAAALLPLVTAEATPPLRLGDRILTLAAQDGTASQGPPPRVGDLYAVDTTRVFPRPLGWWPATAAAAAVLAIVAVGLGFWGAAQHTQLVNQRAAANAQAILMANALTALSAGGSLIRTGAAGTYQPVLLIQPSDGSAAYALVTWSPAPAGKSYQAWFIKAGQKPQSAVVFGGTSSGVQVLRLSGPITGVQTFAVTLEPAGGSLQPSSEPFLASSIPS